MPHSSIFTSLAHVFQIPLKSNVTRRIVGSGPVTTRLNSQWQQSSSFSSTARTLARGKNQPKIDQRISTYSPMATTNQTKHPQACRTQNPANIHLLTALIRYFLQHPITPRPLRLSRLRSLRHWTIHRAWQLYQFKLRAAENLELERQYFSMRNACEELRVGCGDGGRLYRQAMVKKGTYGGLKAEKGREGGVPIEYTRAQTDTPPRDGWDHEWRR
ncbi:hypothetical protein MMC27_004431 [Xylographa pallens]|nr:hypothetical protein [Xylographa pallens]